MSETSLKPLPVGTPYWSNNSIYAIKLKRLYSHSDQKEDKLRLLNAASSKYWISVILITFQLKAVA